MIIGNFTAAIALGVTAVSPVTVSPGQKPVSTATQVHAETVQSAQATPVVSSNLASVMTAPIDVSSLGCFIDPQASREILASPGIARLLPDLLSRVRSMFPEAEEIAVEGHVDPDGSNQVPEVFVVVRSRQEVDDLIARLDRLDNEWWNEHRAEAGGRLEVTVEKG